MRKPGANMKKQFVIVAVMPGCEMFISSARADVSDSIEGALKFTYGEDDPEIKAAAFDRITGLGKDTGMGYWEARAI
jgi:hypothetical protein